MYYITNQNNQIIAADPSLLSLLELDNINELYGELALGKSAFSLSSEDETVTISTAENEETYDVEEHPLTSILGEMTLIQIKTSSTKSMQIDDSAISFLSEEDPKDSLEEFLDLETTAKEEISAISDDHVSLNYTTDFSEDPISILDHMEEEHTKIEIKEDTVTDAEDDDGLFDLLLPDEAENKIDEISLTEEKNEVITPAEKDDELFDLLLPDEAENKIDEISLTEEKNEVITPAEKDDELFDLLSPDLTEAKIDEISLTEEKKEIITTDDGQSPIVIDIDSISQSIGISTEDYNTFLDQYIDSALSFEKDLQSTDEEKRSYAIGTLSHLSNVLHLPVIGDILTQIKNASVEDQDSYITSFYATFSRLTTTGSETEEIADESKDDMLLSEVEPETETPTEEAPVEEAPVIETANGFGHINLDDVKSIHFDFQMEQAASDLELPVELIEEFVNDFITQSHTETKKMLRAYEEGDLDAIQKIGHLLKGTSSNLRINPLSDTLYEIQFCEDSSKLEALIKNYWGHFLSLEKQIELTSK